MKRGWPTVLGTRYSSWIALWGVLLLLGNNGFVRSGRAETDPRLHAARIRHYEGNWKEALPLYVQIASDSKGCPEALLSVASILEEQKGDFLRAAKLYRKASKHDSCAKEATLCLALLKDDLLHIVTQNGQSLKGFRLEQEAIPSFAGISADPGTIYLLLEGGTVESLPAESVQNWAQAPIDPPAYELWKRDAKSYRRRKYEQLLAYLPNSILTRLWYASFLEEEGHLWGALLHLNRAASLAPTRQEIQLRLGLLMLKLGETQAATATLTPVLKKESLLSPLNEQNRTRCRSIAQYLSGERLREAGDPQKAREALVASIKLYDGLPEAYFALAECLVALRRDELAIEAYKKGLALAPFSMGDVMGLCFALDRVGKPLEAAKRYVDCSEILGTGDQDDAFHAWGKQTIQKAKAILTKKRKHATQSAQLHNIGVHYLQIGLYDEAEDALRQAMASGGSSPATWASLGNCLMAVGRLEEAIEAYEATLKLNADRETTRANLAHVLYLREEYQASRSHYEQLVASKNEQMKADAHYNLGIIQLQLKETQLALKEFALALASNPKHVRAYNNLGIAQEELGLTEQAEQSYLKAIHLSPWHKSARLNLAGLYCREKRSQEALLSLKRLQNTPLWDQEADLLWKRAESGCEEKHDD